MAAKKVVRKKTAKARKVSRKSIARKSPTKTKVAKKATSKRKPTAKKKTAATRKKSSTARRSVTKTTKKKAASALGRPRVAGTAELELMFRKDRDAREVFEFLGVKTLKELETLTPDVILERLTLPMVRTVQRIRKALAMNNRCLAGDQKFAVAFKKQLP